MPARAKRVSESDYGGRPRVRLPSILWIASVIMIAICAPIANAEATNRLKCSPFTMADLPTPVPQADPHAIERFQIINTEVMRPHTVLFLGDSLTEKWDATIWREHFAARGAVNAGVNGDRTEHLLWRLKHGNLDGPAPPAVVLLIGTNDIGRNRPRELVAEGIRASLDLVRSRLPDARILLLGVLPRSESPASSRRRQVREVNDLIRSCADGEYVVYMALSRKAIVI